jgi:hypothetical protein
LYYNFMLLHSCFFFVQNKEEEGGKIQETMILV